MDELIAEKDPAECGVTSRSGVKAMQQPLLYSSFLFVGYGLETRRCSTCCLRVRRRTMDRQGWWA